MRKNRAKLFRLEMFNDYCHTALDAGTLQFQEFLHQVRYDRNIKFV